MPNDVRTLDRLRGLCLSLPETSEVQAWGHPNFRAGKKTFAVFEVYRNRPCIAVKTEPSMQDLMVDDDRFIRSPYVGKHGWVSMWVDREIDWNLVEDLVTRSYRLVALKRMVRALDAREHT